MNMLDSLLTALQALRANAMRSVLTMLGIIIGVAAVITMVSVGAGAEAQVAERIRSLGANLLIIRPGSLAASGRRLGAGSGLSLTEDDAVAVRREVASVQAVAASVAGNGQLVYGNQNWTTLIRGVSSEYATVREWEVASGRTFTEAEFRGARKVALLGETAAQNVFGAQDPVGQNLRINKVPFEVIGVLARKGESLGGRDQDDEVQIPLATAKLRVLGGTRFKGGAVQAIFVKVLQPHLMPVAEQDIRALLRQRHRLQAQEPDDFQIRNLAEIQQAREESSRVLKLLLAAVASVSLVVGGIGIMNIMLVSVTERTREIGLRMAVGAGPRQIQSQFLVEAVALSLLGGLVGIGTGVGAAVGIAIGAGWPVLLQPGVVLLAFAFSGGVGVFFGFYPALKAARLDPIEALRHE